MLHDTINLRTRTYFMPTKLQYNSNYNVVIRKTCINNIIGTALYNIYWKQIFFL